MNILDRLFNRKRMVVEINVKASPFVSSGPITGKRYVLKKDFPSMAAGAILAQSEVNTNVYFCGVPVSSNKPKDEQVGILKIESKHVENNFEWFALLPSSFLK